MNRSAVAYLANGTLIVAPVVRTTTGLGLEIEPCVCEPDEGQLALALQAALGLSDRIVPHPSQDDWKGFFKPFQDAAGVRSYKAFMNSARQVSVEIVDGSIAVTPQHNLGEKEGFKPIKEEATWLPVSDQQGAAAAVLRLLA